MEPLFTPIEYVRLKIEAIMRLPFYEGGMVKDCLESLPTLEDMTTEQLRHAYRRLDYLEKQLKTHGLILRDLGFRDN